VSRPSTSRSLSFCYSPTLSYDYWPKFGEGPARVSRHLGVNLSGPFIDTTLKVPHVCESCLPEQSDCARASDSDVAINYNFAVPLQLAQASIKFLYWDQRGRL